jgi:fructose transport system substrate-binding protein
VVAPGVADVERGIIGATSQQYPLLMASLGVEAIAAWAADGSKPSNTPGLDFYNTGVNLVTDDAASGVDSISVKEGMDRCWG